MKNISDLRKDYQLERLDEADSADHPFQQFEHWWEQAVASGIEEVNAMTLSTVGEDLRPSSRIVLLKGFDETGFSFFTNYQSRKSREILANGNVSLVFFWKELERQVRIEGIARQLNDADNDSYFQSRPDESKIGAWSSPQSTVIESRKTLEENELVFREKFSGGNIPRPPHWGGYNIKPSVFEFWQGRPGRLHDRLRYVLTVTGSWRKERLAP